MPEHDDDRRSCEPRSSEEGAWPTGEMWVAELSGRGEITVRRRSVPSRAPNSALVAVTRVGLCGSDLELLEGSSAYVRSGRASYPLVPGHEWVGRVAAVEGPSRLRAGQRVLGKTMLTCHACDACDSGRENECGHLREVGLYDQQGAAAEYICVPTSSLVPVPDAVDDRQATLVEPAVTVLEGLSKVDIRPAARVAVVGPGTLGLLAVQVLAHYPVELTVFGLEETALSASLRSGAARARLFDPAQDTGVYDVVVDSSGSTSGFEDAQRALAVGGALVALGVPHQALTRFDVGGLVLAGHSYVGVRHGMSHYRAALRLFELGVLTGHEVIGPDFPLAQAAAAFASISDPRRGAPKVSLTPATSRAGRYDA